MREFILLALKARTTPDFELDRLAEAGRMNTVCRTILNTLCLSNDLRRDTIIHVALSGPKSPPKIITLEGKTLKGIQMDDEQDIAKAIKLALKKGLSLQLNEEIEVSPGLKVSKKAFETLVKEKSKTHQIIYLHQDGEDIRDFKFKENVLFVLGDFIGLPRKTEKFLDNLGADLIKLGPKMLFASHCPIIVHNELDRRETS